MNQITILLKNFSIKRSNCNTSVLQVELNRIDMINHKFLLIYSELHIQTYNFRWSSWSKWPKAVRQVGPRHLFNALPNVWKAHFRHHSCTTSQSKGWNISASGQKKTLLHPNDSFLSSITSGHISLTHQMMISIYLVMSLVSPSREEISYML